MAHMCLCLWLKRSIHVAILLAIFYRVGCARFGCNDDQAEQFEIQFAQDLYGAAKANADKLAILWVIAIMVSGLMAWLTSFPVFPKRADGF